MLDCAERLSEDAAATAKRATDTDVRHRTAKAVVDRLNARHRNADALECLAAAQACFGGDLAVVSSFGVESAVLLHLVAQVDTAIPVLFLDTQKHFGETLQHRDALTARLGLSDVRSLRPAVVEVAMEDPTGTLHASDPDACCALRKTRPLAHALAGFQAWITGRKRFQNAERLSLPVFELDSEDRVKVNPLANWAPKDLDAYLEVHDLPRHPLSAQGYPSIGCAPCTTPVAPGEDSRAGRWRGREKSECGIHIDDDGRVHRAPAEATPGPFSG